MFLSFWIFYIIRLSLGPSLKLRIRCRLLLANGKPLKGPRLYFVWMETGYGNSLAKFLVYVPVKLYNSVCVPCISWESWGFRPDRACVYSLVVSYTGGYGHHQIAQSTAILSSTLPTILLLLPSLSMATCNPGFNNKFFFRSLGSNHPEGVGQNGEHQMK